MTFALLSLGEFVESSFLLHPGGYIGLLAAVLAWSGSAAGVVNPTWGRTVLAVFPRRRRVAASGTPAWRATTLES